MKKFLLLASVIFSVSFMSAQTVAWTQDGKRIIIFQNGTWFYADSLANGNWNFNAQVQGAGEMYNEAYDYAFEVVYGEEFFSQERQNKAAQWAVDYLRQNIVITIGSRSIESWYDELYGIAFDKVYRNTFFSSERKQSAINWAKGLLEQKATYEMGMNNNASRLARQRAAYNLALNKIFSTEFFSGDRKRRAAEWANNFVRNRR